MEEKEFTDLVEELDVPQCTNNGEKAMKRAQNGSKTIKPCTTM